MNPTNPGYSTTNVLSMLRSVKQEAIQTKNQEVDNKISALFKKIESEVQRNCAQDYWFFDISQITKDHTTPEYERIADPIKTRGFGLSMPWNIDIYDLSVKISLSIPEGVRDIFSNVDGNFSNSFNAYNISIKQRYEQSMLLSEAIEKIPGECAKALRKDPNCKSANISFPNLPGSVANKVITHFIAQGLQIDWCSNNVFMVQFSASGI